jgi:hypothetical protein
MTKIYSSLAALAVVSAAAPAFAGTPQTLTRDGITYVYSVEETARGTVIKGRQQGGRPFLLRVSKGRVTGYTNDHPVSFSVNSVERSNPQTALTEISSSN